MTNVRHVLFTVALLLGAAASANAQLPVTFSLNAGVTLPAGDIADTYDTGFHIGGAVKLLAFPVQIEAAYDFMPTSPDDDLRIINVGVAAPFTFGAGPVVPYLIAGGGFYKWETIVTKTNAGVSGGAGVRIGIPGVRLFAEGRGVLIIRDDEISYFTLGLGLRF